MAVTDSIGKHNEAIWTRIAVDPLAIPVAKWLARRRFVTPNRITAVAGLCAFGASIAFAAGSLRVGGALFIVRFFVDCLDGKVARAQGTSSTTGGVLDLVADVGGIGVCIAALGWRLIEDAAVDPAAPLFLLACVVFYNWVLSTRKSLTKQFAEEGDGGSGGEWTTDVPVLRSWVRLSRRMDMTPVPWALEVEILSLGLIPLLAPHVRFVGYGLWFALAFYVVADVVNLRRVLRLTRRIDAARDRLGEPAR